MRGTLCVWMLFGVSASSLGLLITWIKKIQRKINDFFFTDPKYFINDHFPWQSLNEAGDSNTWQLLSEAISLESFIKTLIEIKTQCNVIPLIHKEGIMEAHEEVDIVIGEQKSFFAIQLQSSPIWRQECHSTILLVCVRKDLGVFQFLFECLQMEDIIYTFLAKIKSQRDGILR